MATFTVQVCNKHLGKHSRVLLKTGRMQMPPPAWVKPRTVSYWQAINNAWRVLECWVTCGNASKCKWIACGPCRQQGKLRESCYSVAWIWDMQTFYVSKHTQEKIWRFTALCAGRKYSPDKYQHRMALPRLTQNLLGAGIAGWAYTMHLTIVTMLNVIEAKNDLAMMSDQQL